MALPPQQRRPPWWQGLSGSLVSRPASLRAVAGDGPPPGRGLLTPCAWAAWPDAGCIRPVLKHGPRSATVVRVFGRQTRVMRNEGEGGTSGPPRREPRRAAHRRPIRCHAVAGFE